MKKKRTNAIHLLLTSAAAMGFTPFVPKPGDMPKHASLLDRVTKKPVDIERIDKAEEKRLRRQAKRVAIAARS